VLSLRLNALKKNRRRVGKWTRLKAMLFQAYTLNIDSTHKGKWSSVDIQAEYF
jgi:hypothetical protein